LYRKEAKIMAPTGIPVWSLHMVCACRCEHLY
jgi:hypothetical protein